MLEVKSNKFMIAAQNVNVLGDVAVSISFDADIDDCAFQKLCSVGHHMPESGYEGAYAAYALYLVLQDKLCGNPLSVKNSRVGRVNVGYCDKELSFSFNMKGVASHVRKTLGLAVSALKPSALFSIYQQLLRQHNLRPNRETFNYEANKLAAGIKAGISCIVIGKIGLGKTAAEAKEKLSDIVKVISGKINPGNVAAPQSRPAASNGCGHEKMTELNVSGWKAFVVQDYIVSKIRGILPVRYNNKLVLPVDSGKYAANAVKLKKGVADFVAKKYARLADDCGPVLAYKGVLGGMLSVSSAKQLCGAKVGDIKSAIEKGL